MRRKTSILMFAVIALVGIMGAAFGLAPNSYNISVHAASGTERGFINLYDKDCADKLPYGQVEDVYEYHNNVGWVWDRFSTINGENSYTSGFIDVRGYSYFTTNNDKSFEIIGYNADKEPVAWIAENEDAEYFREGENNNHAVFVSMPIVEQTGQRTINGRTLLAINHTQEFAPKGNNGGGTVVAVAAGVGDVTKQIAFVRVAFPNSEQNPYFNAFADDFEMLIKLNRDETSGAVMNALMIDITDGVFSGFMLTALNRSFAVGTIIKNTSNEIIFSVPSAPLYCYYTAANGGWQSILTGVEYFSYYGNETVTLNCPTSIAMYESDLADIPPEDNTLGNGTGGGNNTDNSETTINNIFGNSALQVIFAVFGGLALLTILSALIGGRRK